MNWNSAGSHDDNGFNRIETIGFESVKPIVVPAGYSSEGTEPSGNVHGVSRKNSQPIQCCRQSL